MSLVYDDVLPLQPSEHRRVLHRDLERSDDDRERCLRVLSDLLPIESVLLLLLGDELDVSLSERSNVGDFVGGVGESSSSDLLSFQRGTVILKDGDL